MCIKRGQILKISMVEEPLGHRGIPEIHSTTTITTIITIENRSITSRCLLPILHMALPVIEMIETKRLRLRILKSANSWSWFLFAVNTMIRAKHNGWLPQCIRIISTYKGLNLTCLASGCYVFGVVLDYCSCSHMHCILIYEIKFYFFWTVLVPFIVRFFYIRHGHLILYNPDPFNK